MRYLRGGVLLERPLETRHRIPVCPRRMTAAESRQLTGRPDASHCGLLHTIDQQLYREPPETHRAGIVDTVLLIDRLCRRSRGMHECPILAVMLSSAQWPSASLVNAFYRPQADVDRSPNRTSNRGKPTFRSFCHADVCR
jgi:hypothetical protein